MTKALFAGAVAGYLLVLATNPVRASLRDGLRAVRRYPRLWLTLGVFGCGYALFQLGVRLYFFLALPHGEGPPFFWVGEQLWRLPPEPASEVARSAVLPALDSLGGLFNNLVSTFPLSAFAALLLLVNWHGHQGVVWRALTRRFGSCGWLLHGAILLTALVALVKPLLFVPPRFIEPALWFQWSPVAAWLAFMFEYLFGVCVQVYLLLLAFCWVRGVSFDPRALLDFAIRRCAFVLRWAGVVLLLSTVLIDLPLILKNFAPFAAWLEGDAAALDRRNALARLALNTIFLLGVTVQITLTFHNESLRHSWRDHARFLRRHGWSLAWFILLAALHFFALHFLNAFALAALEEGAAPWIAWNLLFPWFAGLVGAWLLAAWVSFFRRADTGRLSDAIRF